MNNYIDVYGRYHDKPVPVSGEPSSNNGWIYTAYAAKAGVPVDSKTLESCFFDCIDVSTVNFPVIRSPNKRLPHISRDEILGMVSLKLLTECELSNWDFCPLDKPKFSLIKLVKQLWELRPGLEFKPTHHNVGYKMFVFLKLMVKFKHRNYFWQNSLDQIYRFAFSVPVQDRHFILKKWDKFQFYNPIHVFYAAVAKVDSMLPKKSGIKWLKYGGEENKAAMVKEFPEDHPIRQKLGL